MLCIGEIKRLIGLPETKYIDTAAVAITGPDVTGAAGSFSNIAQGVGAGQRVGLQVRQRHFTLRGIFFNPPINTAPLLGRLIIGLDLESQGVTPTAAQVLEPVNAGAVSVLSPYNVSTTRGRFRILKDRHFILSAGAIVAAAGVAMNAIQGSAKFMKYRIKMKSKLEFAGPNAADFRQNSIFYLYISSGLGANAAQATIQGRLAYQDV